MHLISFVVQNLNFLGYCFRCYALVSVSVRGILTQLVLVVGRTLGRPTWALDQTSHNMGSLARSRIYNGRGRLPLPEGSEFRKFGGDFVL